MPMLGGAEAEMATVRIHMSESFTVNDKYVLRNVHMPWDCRGPTCTIHRSTPHHMQYWPLDWREDTYSFERVCPHGIGHPDPDQPHPHRVHGCDGCCAP